jgi:hypothetical protein
VTYGPGPGCRNSVTGHTGTVTVTVTVTRDGHGHGHLRALTVAAAAATVGGRLESARDAGRRSPPAGR